MNELGDYQMETYFDVSATGGGMLCHEDYDELGSLFFGIENTNRKTMEEIGGEYIPHKNEGICSIRLARSAFFKVCDPIDHILLSPIYHFRVISIT